MKHYIASTGIALIAAIAPLKVNAATFSQIYTFGDSLSDPGNLFQLTNALGGVPGVGLPTVPQSPPYAQRFSNGPVWIEYLAEDLGLDPVPATNFLGLLTGDLSIPEILTGDFGIEEGINFAFGGAGTGADNIVAPQLPVGVLSQIEVFSLAAPFLNPAEDALYVYFAGGNDLAGSSATPPQDDLSIPLGNTGLALQALIDLGAKNILVSNLPDISKTPRFSLFPESFQTLLSSRVTAYNQGLASAIDLLSLNAPDVKFIEFDFNGLFLDAIANPDEYGFDNVTDACLTDYTFPNDTDGFSICSNPDPNSYLFWDDFHPTTVAHQIVANAAFAQLHEPESVPEPGMSWSLVAVGTVAVGGAMYRGRTRRKVA